MTECPTTETIDLSNERLAFMPGGYDFYSVQRVSPVLNSMIPPFRGKITVPVTHKFSLWTVASEEFKGETLHLELRLREISTLPSLYQLRPNWPPWRGSDVSIPVCYGRYLVWPEGKSGRTWREWDSKASRNGLRAITFARPLPTDVLVSRVPKWDAVHQRLCLLSDVVEGIFLTRRHSSPISPFMDTVVWDVFIPSNSWCSGF